MAADRTEWAKAYARQARSDFSVYALLARNLDVETCHALHFLQMAGEKIAKAFRFRDTGTGLDALLSEHVALSVFIPSFIRSAPVLDRYRTRHGDHRGVSSLAGKLRDLARDIERLAPAVDREQSPRNVEYPWEEGGKVLVPCDYVAFPDLNGFEAGRTFLRLLEIAIQDFEEVGIH